MSAAIAVQYGDHCDRSVAIGIARVARFVDGVEAGTGRRVLAEDRLAGVVGRLGRRAAPVLGAGFAGLVDRIERGALRCVLAVEELACVVGRLGGCTDRIVAAFVLVFVFVFVLVFVFVFVFVLVVAVVGVVVIIIVLAVVV